MNCCKLIIGICLALGCCCTKYAEVSGACNRTRYIQHNGMLVINATVSSEVFNISGVASVPECLIRCKIKGCAAAVFWKGSGLCQLVTVSQDPGSSGTSERRLVGTEADAIAMKLEGFNDLMKPTPSINVTRVFTNTAIGRTGSIQQTVINVTGCYHIEIAGAKGGDNTIVSTDKFGGRGALVAGNAILTAATELSIVVGQAGSSSQNSNGGAGGGGGSFVYRTVGTQLLVAAGGGGGASYTNNGGPGLADTSGSNSLGSGTSSLVGTGGANGNPGSNNPSATPSSTNYGGCGAGWLGKAAVGSNNYKGDGGGSRPEIWAGGNAGSGSTADGGFGGGGGAGTASDSWSGSAGAGGGYSGGGAGVGGDHRGGGGGSFCGGSGCLTTTGGNTGSNHGFVVLRLVDFAATCA